MGFGSKNQSAPLCIIIITNTQITMTIHSNHKLLIIVDPQKDFINGTLAVNGAEDAMNNLSDYIANHHDRYRGIVLTADRHPSDHISFAENHGDWPAHCVADSDGADIWPPLITAIADAGTAHYIFYKGTEPDREEYSVFENPKASDDITALIRDNDIKSVDICGIAGDFCVLETLRDLRHLFPKMKIRVLDKFTASLDGGTKLNNEIKRLRL